MQKDDTILDLGCGGKFPSQSSLANSRMLVIEKPIIDGVINLQLAQTLSQGKGRIHGVDANEAIIAAARKAAASNPAATKTCTFEGNLLDLRVLM